MHISLWRGGAGSLLILPMGDAQLSAPQFLAHPELAVAVPSFFAGPHLPGVDEPAPAATELQPPVAWPPLGSTVWDPNPVFAVGLLSMTPSASARRNARATMHRRFAALLQSRTVVVRYLLAGQGTEELEHENATHGDLLLLPTPEGIQHCWRKVTEWFAYALVRYPRTPFIGLSDDDAYLHLERVSTDLALLHALGHRHVYWGQPMWMSYWNRTTFEGGAFAGYSAEDGEAVRLWENSKGRSRFRLSSPAPEVACTAPKRPGQREVAHGPTVFMNSDLVVVGRDLARAILASDCHRHYHASLAEQLELAKLDRNHLLARELRRNKRCYPIIDQVLGWHVINARVNVTFVEVGAEQGWPWPRFATVPQHVQYVHKMPRDDISLWQHYDVLLANTGYERAPRVCSSCTSDDALQRKPLFSPDSPSAASYAGWTCCRPVEQPAPGWVEVCKARLARERRQFKRLKQLWRSLNATLHSMPVPERNGKPIVHEGGYCAATDDSGRGSRHCHSESPAAKGYWKLSELNHTYGGTSIATCIEACMGCEACRFISYSEAHEQEECSWYASCDTAHLAGAGEEGGLGRLCPLWVTIEVKEQEQHRAAKLDRHGHAAAGHNARRAPGSGQ